MKKIIKTIFILICLIMSGCVLAQEVPDYTWDYYLRNHQENQIQKPVTQKEFDEAFETIKKYRGIKDKKKKKGKKDKEEQKEETPSIPSSPNPLLRVLFDLYHNGSIIQKGFYLVQFTDLNDKFYLKFYQSSKNIATVELFKSDQKNSTHKFPLVLSNTLENQINIMYCEEVDCYTTALPIIK